MLDKNDLNQISTIVTKIVKKEVDPLKKDVKLLQKDVSGIQGNVRVIQKDIGVMKQDIVKIREDQNVIINFFDRAYLDLRTRVEKLEQIVSNLTS
ncbi:MAG: hypothetical protein AABY22_05105 [Nanoarchaeota archaeon]